MIQLFCKDVSLGYNGVTVSEHVSFEVRAGDYFCVVGDNGSGKSTLIKTLLRLIEPKSGEVGLGDGITQRDVGYLPQQSEAQQDFPATVREIVTSGCVGKRGLFTFPTKEQRRAVEKNMNRLGIAELASKPYSRLSGGQQRRVLLARALCAADQILLLDEPVAGLDPHAAEELYETVARLNREEGITVFMITHDLSATLTYATQILHMSKTPTLYRSAEEYRNSRDFPGNREVTP